MPSDDFGVPHIDMGGEPPDDQRIEGGWVLIAVTEAGGEGIYSQTIGRYLYNFIAMEMGMRDTLENYLRERGSVEVARRKGVRLEWRSFGWNGETEEIT